LFAHKFKNIVCAVQKSVRNCHAVWKVYLSYVYHLGYVMTAVYNLGVFFNCKSINPFRTPNICVSECLTAFNHVISFLLSCFIGRSKRNSKPKVVQSSNALYIVLIKTMWYT